MSLPTRDDSHVAEGLAYLTSQFKGQAALVALLTALLNRVQDLEDVLWDVIDSQLLTTPPTGQALDQIADLVGTTRDGFDDTLLLLFVRVFIRARRSGGRAEGILSLLALAISGFSYAEWYPAAFEIVALNIPQGYAQPLARALAIARDPGVNGVFGWSTWAPSLTMRFADQAGRSLGQGFADSVSGAFAYQFISAAEV